MPQQAAGAAPPVSAYVRTLNEARTIARVVAAARAAADEVIVVDSGSTDDTAALAEAAGARVLHVPWRGNGHQKRAGEEAARHDWLLDLDADEEVSPALAAAIRRLFADGAPAESAYALSLCLRPPGGPVWTGFFAVPRAKLYDRRVHRQPAHAAWDQLPGVSPKRLVRLDGALIHHGYRDLAQMVDKMNRVSSVRARETRRRGRAELALRIVFGFPVYFARQFVGKGGWRAGVYGVAVCAILSLSRWLRDVKQYEEATGRGADADADGGSGRGD